jgi:hypothetical protein
MSAYDEKIKDTQQLFGALRKYREQFTVRKNALQDLGLMDHTALEHTFMEWLYALDKRLSEVEDIVKGSTGDEREQPVEIPLSVNHLGK